MNAFGPLWPLLLAALLPALVGLALAWSCRGRRSVVSRLGRALAAALLLLISALIALLGVSVLGYARLVSDVEVARIAVERIGEQHFAVNLDEVGGTQQRFELRGDQWQLDARVLRWELPAALAGAPPLYRLERLSGRYQDDAQQREAERSVHGLADRRFPDLWILRRQFPQWLEFVDADYGSAAYLPLIDGAQFEVSLSPRGGLVARPADERTQKLLDEAGW